jgi:pimeloyl-ACP methyl ester carboxylesterase
VAHGLGASVAESRPFLSGVPGTKAFVELRGHGRPWTGEPGYQVLADDLLAEADRVGATRALGVSLGAGALLRLLAQDPSRFARVVLVLPAALHRPHPSAVRRGAALVAALRAGDRAAVERLVRAEVPEGLDAYVAARVDLLLASDLVPLLEALATDVPVPDPASLAAVTAEVLVLGAEGDDVHPVAVAREVAAALPSARLVAFARPSPLVHERERLRSLVTAHLAGPSG